MHRRGAGYLQWTKRGIHLPVVEASIRYKRSVKFDERIAIEATLKELGRATVKFTYRILRDDENGDLVADGVTTLACVDEDLAVKRIPDDIATLLCQRETHPRPVDQA